MSQIYIDDVIFNLILMKELIRFEEEPNIFWAIQEHKII